MAGATIYVTLAPCVDCFLAIVASGARSLLCYVLRCTESCLIDGYIIPSLTIIFAVYMIAAFPHPAGIRRCVYRGRNRCAEVQQLAEREFVLLGEGFDMANSGTWEPAAEEVWKRYYAKYPEVRVYLLSRRLTLRIMSVSRS